MGQNTVDRQDALTEAARLTDMTGRLHVVREDHGVFTPCQHFESDRYLSVNAGNESFGVLLHESARLIAGELRRRQ